jgi:hypothetical protein
VATPGIGLWDGNVVELPFSATVSKSSSLTLNTLAGLTGYTAGADGFILGVAVDSTATTSANSLLLVQPLLSGSPIETYAVMTPTGAAISWVKTNRSKLIRRFRSKTFIQMQLVTDAHVNDTQLYSVRLMVGYDRVCPEF